MACIAQTKIDLSVDKRVIEARLQSSLTPFEPCKYTILSDNGISKYRFCLSLKHVRDTKFNAVRCCWFDFLNFVFGGCIF